MQMQLGAFPLVVVSLPECPNTATWVEHMRECSRILFCQDGSLRPVVNALCVKDGAWAQITVDLGPMRVNQEARRQGDMMLPLVLKAIGARVIVKAGEVWLSAVKPENSETLDNLADVPDKKEALLFHCEGLPSGPSVIVQEIVRPEGGPPILLAEQKGGAAGWAPLLTVPTATHAMAPEAEA